MIFEREGTGKPTGGIVFLFGGKGKNGGEENRGEKTGS